MWTQASAVRHAGAQRHVCCCLRSFCCCCCTYVYIYVYVYIKTLRCMCICVYIDFENVFCFCCIYTCLYVYIYIYTFHIDFENVFCFCCIYTCLYVRIYIYTWQTFWAAAMDRGDVLRGASNLGIVTRVPQVSHRFQINFIFEEAAPKIQQTRFYWHYLYRYSWC